MIAEKTLKRWLKEALIDINQLPIASNAEAHTDIVIELQKRILRMTQIMLHQHLIK